MIKKLVAVSFLIVLTCPISESRIYRDDGKLSCFQCNSKDQEDCLEGPLDDFEVVCNAPARKRRTVIELIESFDDPSEPTNEPSEPTNEPSEPTENPSEPTDEPSEPTDEPSEPTDEPSEPTDEPSEPTDEPSEPTDEPSEPTDEPTEPTDEPTEPTDEPTEPTDEPTEPTDEPTEPTQPPNVDYRCYFYKEQDVVFRGCSSKSEKEICTDGRSSCTTCTTDLCNSGTKITGVLFTSMLLGTVLFLIR